MNGQVHAVAVFDDGCGPVLYVAGEFSMAGGPALVVGGDFTMIDGKTAHRIAFLRRPQMPVTGDLTSDGVVDVADLMLILANWG